MTEPMGLREFGRWVDLSGEGVRKAIREGRIPAEFVGERTVGNGKKWPVITDPEAARRALGRNTNQAMQRDKAVLSENRARVAKGQPKRPLAEIAAGEAADEPVGAGTLKAGKEIPSQAESNAVAAVYKARMAKLEYEERVGKLVNAEKVKAGVIAMITTSKTRILGVPSKAKARIPTLTVSDIELLEEMLAEAMEELSVGN